MKIAAISPPGGHFIPLMDQLVAGIERNGDTVERTLRRNLYPGIDAVVCWGWRTAKGVKRFNPDLPVLVMERGYVGDRFHWTSLGWNGLNGRAIFPKPQHSRLGLFCIDQWRTPFDGRGEGYLYDIHALRGGYALILGQVQSDQACVDVNLAYQYRAWAAWLAQRGIPVKFRPHPKALRQASGLPQASYLYGTLAEALERAKFTISWNSNSSVDSVLAGVPSVTLDRGAMAWPVTSHSLSDPVTMPSRTEWAAQLAWCQWQPSELLDGTAWKAVREVMP